MFLASFFIGVYECNERRNKYQSNKNFQYYVTHTCNTTFLMMSNYDRFLFLNRSDGFVEDEYEVSEKMSTYLVCIIICDFVARNGTTKNNIQVQ